MNCLECLPSDVLIAHVFELLATSGLLACLFACKRFQKMLSSILAARLVCKADDGIK